MNCHRLAAFVLLAILAWLAVAGCGEKIAIPEPYGLFSVAPYLESAVYPDNNPRQILTAQGALFVLTADSLNKRNQNYELVEGVVGVGGLTDPTALCSDDADTLVFVWDQGLGQVSWYRVRDLTPPPDLPQATVLPAVQRCVSMTTSRAGIEQVPGAFTFLYLADPDSGVVHRYAYEPFTGLIPHGILCHHDGAGTRFVHEPAGMARDYDDSLLVCDRDTLRNWVIRFSSVPDLTDISLEGEDLLRGHAALFRAPECNPPAADKYVLGNAASCEGPDWQPGPSSEEGEFDLPVAVTVDGSGRIYVSDAGNDRVQIFGPDGIYEVAYGDDSVLPSPQSLAVVDIRRSAARVYYGAYLYVVSDGEVRRFISGEYFDAVNEGQPPPE